MYFMCVYLFNSFNIFTWNVLLFLDKGIKLMRSCGICLLLYFFIVVMRFGRDVLGVLSSLFWGRVEEYFRR